MYYLNARYYNPAWRRFISPDDTAYIDPETPNGLNLYCYCNNDPVNYADPSGNSVTAILIGAFIWGSLVGIGVSAATQWIENDFNVDAINPFVLINDAIFGGISGMLAVSGIGSFWLAPLNAALGTIQTAINAGIKGKELNPTELVTTAILNYAFAFIPMPNIKARQTSEVIELSQLRKITSVKYKLLYSNMIKDEYKKMIVAAGAYAISTPVFSLISSKTSKYMETYIYGTRRYYYT